MSPEQKTVRVIEDESDAVDIRDSLEAGASTYLTKPASTTALKNSVDRLTQGV